MGWLDYNVRAKVKAGFAAVTEYVQTLCGQLATEVDFSTITLTSLNTQGSLGAARQPMQRTVPESRYVAAALCAQGGDFGTFTGAGCDVANCQYTFGELPPAKYGNLTFCMYQECEGWDPVHGMPLYATHATAATAITPPM
jgi:hypothetical protein